MNEDARYPRYSVTMEWDPSDHIYVVSVPELLGCMTHGATLQEAAAQAQDAIESWVDAARERGIPLPEPRVWTDDDEQAAGS